MVEGFRRHSPPHHGTDHDSKLAIVSGVLFASTPTSVPAKKVSKCPCDCAKVRPQSTRAAICPAPRLRPSSWSGASSSSLYGDFSSSYTMRRIGCRRCGVVAAEEVSEEPKKGSEGNLLFAFAPISKEDLPIYSGDYFSNARIACGAEFACARAATPACMRI